VHWEPAVFLDAGATLACLTIAIVAWRRRSRSSPASMAFVLLMLGVAEMSATVGLASLLDDPRAKMAAALAAYFGAGVLTAAMFVYARALADANYSPGWATIALLAVEPVLIVTLAATNSFHHLVLRGEIGSTTWGIYTYHSGPATALNLTYAFVLITAALVIIARACLRATSVHRLQLASLPIASIVPAAAQLWVLTRPGGTASNPDFTSLMFAVSGIVLAWSLFRHGLLQIIPVARNLVLEKLSDAVIVLDTRAEVLDINPAGEALARAVNPGLPARIVGLPGQALMPAHAGAATLTPGSRRAVVSGVEVDLDIRITELFDRKGRQLGCAVVIRDVTELGQERRKLAGANDRLREQLHTIEKLRADLAEQAVRDVLTGLHNRRHLIETLDAELRHAADDGRPLSVVMLDIDHFKHVNDTHGHTIGDDLLVALSCELADAVREGDTVARYGGEEFVILLPDTDAATANHRAEILRLRCAAVAVYSADGSVATTISAGIATFPASGITAGHLLAAADKALYRAKAAGRNRVLLAS
jgi:diguanylate cyclase (GGDEF)-like protein